MTHKLELDVLDLKTMSKAAYFYNIGLMATPSRCFSSKMVSDADRVIYQEHTVAGAKLVCLNDSPSCKYFVRVCSDICMHHHERFDGRDFPHRLQGGDNSIHSYTASFAIAFDRIFNKRSDYNDMQFDFVLREQLRDRGAFSADVVEIAKKCRYEIINYYKSLSV